MMTTWTRSQALEILLECNGGFKAGTCKDDDSWYESHNLLDLRNFILSTTEFLNDYLISFKVRMLCLKLNISEVPKCKFCENICIAMTSPCQFRTICSSKLCKSKQKSISSKKMHDNMSSEKRRLISQKIGNSNKGTLESKFGIDRAKIIRVNISKSQLGRVQSEETKRRRIKSRRNNLIKSGLPWWSIETRAKNSLSNSITHSDPMYEILHAESRKISNLKQSITMKRLIEEGKFTPNSSNYRFSKKINLIVDNDSVVFRSSWEAAYYCTIFYTSGIKLQYEVVRVPYCWNNEKHVYIVDFFNPNGVLIEVRPKCRQGSEKEISKFSAATEWAKNKGYQFVLIDESWFANNKKNVEVAISNYPEVLNKLKGVLR